MVEGDPLPKVLPSYRAQKRQKGNLLLLKLDTENLVAYLHRQSQTPSIRDLHKIQNYILPQLGIARSTISYIFYLSYIQTGTEKVSISVAQKSLDTLCSYSRCSPSIPTPTPSALLKAFMSSFESHQRCYKLINRAETGELLLVHLYIQTKLLFYSVTLVPLASVKQQLQKNTV